MSSPFSLPPPPPIFPLSSLTLRRAHEACSLAPLLPRSLAARSKWTSTSTVTATTDTMQLDDRLAGYCTARYLCSDNAKSACGDGIKLAGEACDDGNPWSGDGCSARCAPEAGFRCTTSSATNLTSCVKCGAGKWASAGMSTCSDATCPPGKGVGVATGSVNATADCWPCAVGFFSASTRYAFNASRIHFLPSRALQPLAPRPPPPSLCGRSLPHLLLVHA